MIDGGSEIYCIREELVHHLDLPVGKRVRLTGIYGRANIVDVVRLHIKPAIDDQAGIINIAPAVRVCFAVVPRLHEPVILTSSVVSLLQDVASYNVLAINGDEQAQISSDGPVNAACIPQEAPVVHNVNTLYRGGRTRV